MVGFVRQQLCLNRSVGNQLLRLLHQYKLQYTALVEVSVK